MIIRFIVYGLLGWSLEIMWTGFTSFADSGLNLIGHTSIWMFFVYGSATFLLEPIHLKILKFNTFTRGIIWTILIFIIEFVSGIILNLLGIEAWHYTSALSVCGVIRLDYAPLWFIVGLLFERVHSYLLLLQKGWLK